MTLKGIRRGGCFRRITVVIILVSFFSADSVIAVPKGRVERFLPKIYIPHNLGYIKETFSGNPDLCIVHIQDAHCNYSAQKNISKIMEHMIKDYGIDQILVEGGWGEDSLYWLRGLGPQDIRTTVADRYLRKGKITAENYLDITSEYKLDIYGVENPSLYKKNLKAFIDLQSRSQEVFQIMEALGVLIGELKKKIYPQDILALESESSKSQPEEYYRALLRLAQVKGIDLGESSSIKQFVQSLDASSKIDFEKVEEERNELIEILTNCLSAEELKQLIESSLQFRLGQLKASGFYGFLLGLKDKAVDKSEIELSQLEAYNEYVSRFETIDMHKVSEDTEDLDEKVMGSYLTQPGQVELYRISRVYSIINKLFSLTLLPKDYNYLKKNRSEFDLAKREIPLKVLVQRYNMDSNNLKELGIISRSINLFERFYTAASKRNKAMVTNAVKRMKEKNQKVAILKTGGFHTQDICKLLKRYNISYIIISPSVKESSDRAVYYACLKDSYKTLNGTQKDQLSPLNGAQDPKTSHSLAREIIQAAPGYAYKEIDADTYLASDFTSGNIVALSGETISDMDRIDQLFIGEINETFITRLVAELVKDITDISEQVRSRIKTHISKDHELVKRMEDGFKLLNTIISEYPALKDFRFAVRLSGPVLHLEKEEDAEKKSILSHRGEFLGEGRASIYLSLDELTSAGTQEIIYRDGGKDYSTRDALVAILSHEANPSHKDPAGIDDKIITAFWSRLLKRKKPVLTPISVASEGESGRVVQYDPIRREILGPKEGIGNILRLDLISVTTDQPEYWPNETVYLKAMLLGKPEEEVEVILTQRGGSPTNLGRKKLSKEGILHMSIMDGNLKNLALGEYEVTVRTIDQTKYATAKFSVVEGTLGALSFAKIKGEFSRPHGARWGHGLKVNALLHHNNLPYTGQVTLQARCYLPGCNGTTNMLPPVTVEVVDGEIKDVVLETTSHSGPFEVEVSTKVGSVRHMFEGSGHVERQMPVLSNGFRYIYRAGLSPYEGTIQVPNRQIWIKKEEGEKEAPIILENCYSDQNGLVRLKVEKQMDNARIFVWVPNQDGSFESRELSGLAASFSKGDIITVPVEGPYSLIIVAGFVIGKTTPFEAHGIVFAQPTIDVEINAPQLDHPGSKITVKISTKDTSTGKGIPVEGFLEVYDTRVPSRDPNRPINAKIGDSVRNAAHRLTGLEDTTGLGQRRYRGAGGATLAGGHARAARKGGAAAAGGGVVAMAAGGGGGSAVGELDQAEEETDIEPIREGTQKVVCSQIVETDTDGRAEITLTLGPQVGRYNVRFTAVKRLETVTKQVQVDASKPASVEVALLPLLIKGARVTARAIVNNITGNPLRLIISGQAMQETREFAISGEKKQQVIEFELEGGRYGELLLEVSDTSGNVLDRRRLQVKDLAKQPVTLSKIVIPQTGEEIYVLPGETGTVYPNAGALLKGIVSNIQTTIYSWFGHGEAVTAGVAIKAIVLQAIALQILDDEGQMDNLKQDIIIGIKDLKKRFFIEKDGLFTPYPGMEETNPLWSAWMARNLSSMVRALKSNDSLSSSLQETISIAQDMIDKVNTSLERRGLSVPELAGYDPKQDNRDVFTFKTKDGIEHQVITSNAVIDWVADKFYNELDLEEKKLAGFLQKAYDLLVRYARTYERIGAMPFLIQTAKSLWLGGDDKRAKFNNLFNQIARGFILTQEPGLIQGPAILGGIYSNPQAAIRFLELLIMMAEERKEREEGDVVQLEVREGESPRKLEVPPYGVAQVTRGEEINIEDYIKPGTPFKVHYGQDIVQMGTDTTMEITLPEEKDPLEYYAIVVLPSTVSLKQTEDILLDYKGGTLFGQRQTGGGKIQMVSVPFRGSRVIRLLLEGAQIGTSPGIVLIRHINNPHDITAITTDKVQVVERQAVRQPRHGSTEEGDRIIDAAFNLICNPEGGLKTGVPEKDLRKALRWIYTGLISEAYIVNLQTAVDLLAAIKDNLQRTDPVKHLAIDILKIVESSLASDNQAPMKARLKEIDTSPLATAAEEKPNEIETTSRMIWDSMFKEQLHLRKMHIIVDLDFIPEEETSQREAIKIELQLVRTAIDRIQSERCKILKCSISKEGLGGVLAKIEEEDRDNIIVISEKDNLGKVPGYVKHLTAVERRNPGEFINIEAIIAFAVGMAHLDPDNLNKDTPLLQSLKQLYMVITGTEMELLAPAELIEAFSSPQKFAIALTLKALPPVEPVNLEDLHTKAQEVLRTAA